MSTFLFVDDSRLKVIADLLEKLNANPDLWSQHGKDLSQRLTSAESVWIAVMIDSKLDDKAIDAATSIAERTLRILDLIGVPLQLPLNKLTEKQLKLIDEGSETLQAVGKLAGKWAIANKEALNE